MVIIEPTIVPFFSALPCPCRNWEQFSVFMWHSLECDLTAQLTVDCSGNFLCCCFIVNRVNQAHCKQIISMLLCWLLVAFLDLMLPLTCNRAALDCCPAGFSAMQVYLPAFLGEHRVRLRHTAPFSKLLEMLLERSFSPKHEQVWFYYSCTEMLELIII